MELLFLFKGLVLGLAVGTPLGPVGAICISRTLDHGAKAGLATGFGAALADGVYTLLASIGLFKIGHLLADLQLWLQLVGGSILLIVAGYLWWRHWQPTHAAEARQHTLLYIASGLFLTLTSPTTILSFLLFFTTLGLEAAPGVSALTAMLCGVVAGSMVWWSVLSLSLERLGQMFSARTIRHINLTAAGLVGMFACYALAQGAVGLSLQSYH